MPAPLPKRPVTSVLWASVSSGVADTPVRSMPAWQIGSTCPPSPTSQITSATDSISRCTPSRMNPKNSAGATSRWAICSSLVRNS